MPDSVINQLMSTIESRKSSSADASYTASLLAGGVDKIGAKITEEAAEVVEAASESGQPGREHLIHESADLIYHLLVMLAHRGVSMEDISSELGRRFGTSGHTEKASRSS